MTMILPAPPSSSLALSISSLESTVQRMLSHPQTFNGFIDILKLPAVRATLASSPTNNNNDSASSSLLLVDAQKQRRRDALIRTVELFAYGTVGEYHDLIDDAGGSSNQAVVWTLNEVMLEKLRMLTVVSVVARRVNGEVVDDDTPAIAKFGSDDVEMNVETKMADAALCERTGPHPTKKKTTKKQSLVEGRTKNNNRSSHSGKKSRADALLSIPYSRLAWELRMPYPNNGDDDSDKVQETKHIRQLEDLLIKCIYSNIISAKLDQLTQCLIVQPHLMLVASSGGGDFVGWETFWGESSSSSSSAAAADASGTSGGEGLSRGVYGSILSRDLRTITPESTSAEITRMSSSLANFLVRSNTLLETLERLSGNTVVKHRKEDEGRWEEVRKVVEEAPTRMRETASPSTQSAFASSYSSYSGAASAAAISASPSTGERGMRVSWGMVRGGTSGGSGSGGGEIRSEVVEVMGRRQVKRSKGGHSMMMNIMGGGSV